MVPTIRLIISTYVIAFNAAIMQMYAKNVMAANSGQLGMINALPT
jgi:hypothetical protein